MKQYIDKTALVAEIKKKLADILACKKDASTPEVRTALTGMIRLSEDILSFINTLEEKEVEEEPVSKDMEEAAYQFGNCFENHFGLASMSFIKGAKWQKEQMITKACNYLFSHMGLFVTFFDDDIVEDIERSEFIKKFRIAMEGKL